MTAETVTTAGIVTTVGIAAMTAGIGTIAVLTIGVVGTEMTAGIVTTAGVAGMTAGTVMIVGAAGMTTVMTVGIGTIAVLTIGVVGTAVIGKGPRRRLPSRLISKPSCAMSLVISDRAGVLTVEAEGAAAATVIAHRGSSALCWPIFEAVLPRSGLYRLVHATSRGVRGGGQDGCHRLPGGGC